MACTTQEIKDNSFNTVKSIIEGKSSSIRMDETGKVTFNYSKSNFYKDKAQAFAVAQSKAMAVEKWAAETFGPTFSKGWTEVLQSENEVSLQYRFPSNLEKAYLAKEAIEQEEENLNKAKVQSLQEQLEAITQGNAETQQMYHDIYGYSYPSIDDMVQGILAEINELEEVDNQIGTVPTLIAPNYEAYYKEKEKMLARVKKTIDRLYTEKRIDNTKGISKRINQLTAIKDNLEKELDDYTKSGDKFTQVKNFFDKDIALIKDLLSNPTLDNLFLAQDIFRFISQSADINSSSNKMFKSEANKVFEFEVKNLIEHLNTQMTFIQKDINDALDIEFDKLLETYQDSLETLYPGKDLEQIKEMLLSNLQDINSVESKFMTVDNNLFTEADVLAQLLRVEYTRVNEKEKSRTQKLIQTIDGAMPAIEKELRKLGYVVTSKVGTFLNYDWLYQKDAAGERQPELVGKYSSRWNSFIYSLNKDYNKKVFEARQARDWAGLEAALTNKYNDLNDKVNFTNFSLLHDIFNSSEYDEFKKGTESEAAAYKAELISQIGQEEYEDLINRQRDYLDSFLEEKESLIKARLIQEKVADVASLSDQVRNNLEITIARLNPMLFTEAHFSGNKSMIVYTLGTQSNEKPSYLKYNTYTPKIKSNTGVDTGFFDEGFKTIEANPELYKFWKIMRTSTKTVNENLIDSNLNLNKNSILLFKKSFRETLMDKNYMSILRAGLGSMLNIKQFIKNQASGKDVDRIDDGEIVLPMNIGTFQAAVTENFKLMKTDLANILGRQIKSGTEIRWDNITRENKQKILDLLGVPTESDFLNDIVLHSGDKFKVYALKLYSQRKVFEQQTLNLPSMLKAQLELSAEHKSRSEAKNRLDVILQKSRQVLTRKNRRGTEENDRTTYWGKDRANANKRNDFFFKQVVINDKKDAAWGNISKELKKLSSTDDGKILGKFFYKNYTPEEKKIYYSAMKRLGAISKSMNEDDLTEAQMKSLINEQRELESRLRILGKDYLGSAIFNAAFNKLAILVNMGFSIPVAINNYANGHMMLFSRDGEFWTKGNINLAWHYVTQNKLRFVNPAYKESWKMMGAFIKQLNIIQDGTNELQRAEDNVSFLQKGLLHPMYGTELVEWYNQVPGILSMAMDIEIAPGIPLFDGKTFPAHKLVNGVFTLKDEYRTEENIKHYEEISSDKMLDWKLQVNDMIRSLNGDYSKTGVTRIKGGVIGKQIMQFKTWLPRYISARYGYKQKNLVTGQEETGYLISSMLNPKTAFSAGLMSVATLAVGAMSGPSVVWMLPLIAPALGIAVALRLIQRGKLNMDLSEVINIRSQLGYVAKALTLGTIETPLNVVGGAFGKKNLLDLDNSFKGKLTPQEEKDLRLLAKHMQFSIGILLLRLIVQAMLGDNEEKELKGKEGSAQRERWLKQQQKKDEDTKTYNLMENFLTSRYQELNLANDPISLFSTMGSKNGLENNLGKLSKAFYNTANGFFFPEDDIITSGERQGQSKSGNTWRKLLLPSPVRGIGQDSWQAGFESWTEREWQNNDFTDKVFDSDFKVDKKQLENKRAAKVQELISQYETENDVKLDELSQEEQDKVSTKIKKQAKKEVPNPDRELYDEEQNLIE